MLKLRLGSTDIDVSPFGLGTVKWGRNEGVHYPAAFQLPTDTELLALLAETKSLGINLLDTAPAYGVSEERLGKLLQGQRQDWILSSKAGEDFIQGQSHFDFSSQAIHRSVERSLQRLQTDYLDILLIHSNGEDQKIIEEHAVFVTLQQLKTAGKIRAFGLSSKTVAGGLLTIDHADVAMVTYNPLHTEERAVIRYAQQKQKGIFIKKAFASGHLLNTSEVLQFIFSEPGVTSVILGTINPKHLRENVEG